MIRFGPSGIPLSCKGRTLRDGIEDVHTLGLTALEVQLVRTNVVQRHAAEEDLGLIPTKMEEELIIEVQRGAGKRRKATTLNEPIEKGDVILTMINPIAKNHIQLKQLGEIAKNLDVVLSVHTPYYMDLVANNDLTERSMESIRWAGILAQALDAQIVLTHMGMYGDISRKEATRRITENIASIQEWYDESEIKVPIGLETSGRQEIFGTFEEIESVCDKVKGPVPAINFPHVHARGNGSLKRKEDFQALFDRANAFTKGRFYTHFSGVEHENGNEIRYTPIKKGDLKFEPLAECILENDMELTVISGSPLLEHDAMYMKVILERVLSKREAKAERQKAKEAEPIPIKPQPKKAAKAPAKKAPAPAKKKQTSKPPAKKPASKKPAAKSPAKKAAVKPVTKKPVPKPAVKKAQPKATAKKPAAKAPVKKPAPKVPVKKPAQKPIAKKPAAKPSFKKPAAKVQSKKPAPKVPVKKPSSKPVAKMPTAKPISKKPAAKIQAKKQPARKPSKAPAKKPAANKQQAKKPATQKPRNVLDKIEQEVKGKGKAKPAQKIKAPAKKASKKR